MQLREYQEKATFEVAVKLASGRRKVVLQLPTGGGKTVMFSSITKRFIEKQTSDVLILVHRRELLNQARKTLWKGFGIPTQPIIAGMKVVPRSRVYIGMVESTLKRIPANIGLVIIDEAHILSFAKIHDYFPSQMIIGVTATPLTANKKKPLRNYYDDIVIGTSISQLIKDGSLTQNITYSISNAIDRKALKIRNGEFDEGMMALAFSNKKAIRACVDAYQRLAPGTKALIFNCSIEHSQLTNQAFVDAGLPSRHLDGEMKDEDRTAILDWFRNTDGAILNNIGILTAGFDEATVETIIVNRATMSLPLWLQMCGRGSRIHEIKAFFKIIDIGGNAATHNDWNFDHDWEVMFLNPQKPGSGGVAPMRNCDKCEAFIPVRQIICPICGHEHPKAEIEEMDLQMFILATSGIDVASLVKANEDKKEYYPFFLIGKQLAAMAKKTTPKMSEETFNFILSQYDIKAKQWCNSKGKQYNAWHKERAKQTLNDELLKFFKAW